MLFTTRDFEGICDVTRKGTAKQQNQKKIGYKGIGFKSVFAISNNILIVSGPFRFSFDQLKCQEGVPWQICPWLLDTTEEPLQMNTCFFITIDPKLGREVIENLRLVFQDEKVLLGINSISTMELNLSGPKVEETNTVFSCVRKSYGDTEPHEIELERDTMKNKLRERHLNFWIKKSFEVVIPQELKESQEFRNFPPVVLPPKLKTAERIYITFAVKHEDEKLCKEQNAKYSCYLPTKVQSGFNFWVNADFSLDLTRESLNQNCWNDFLKEQIGEKQIHWVRWLIDQVPGSEIRKETVFSLLQASKQSPLSPYQKGFNRGLAYPFIPTLEGSFVPFERSIVDETGFFLKLRDPRTKSYKQFQNLSNKELLPKNSTTKYKWTHPAVYKSSSFLTDQGVVRFAWSNFSDLVEDYAKIFYNYQEFPWLLDFLKERNDILTHLPGLRSKKILPTKVQGQLKFSAAQETSISKPGLEQTFLSCFPLLSDKEFSASHVKWFKSDKGLCLPEMSAARLVTIISENFSFVTRQNTVEILKFLFNHRVEIGALLPHLASEFKVLTTTDGFEKIGSVMNPLLLKEKIQVQAIHMTHYDEHEEWASFFSTLGAKTEMDLILSSYSITYYEDRNNVIISPGLCDHLPQIQAFIKDKLSEENLNKFRNKSSSVQVSSLLCFQWINQALLLQKEEYWNALMECLERHIQNLSLQCQITKSKRHVGCEQHLIWYIREKAMIPNTRTNPGPAKYLLAPHLKGESFFPLIDRYPEHFRAFPTWMISQPLAEICGFKGLSPKECFTFLSLLAQEQNSSHNKDQLERLFKRLIQVDSICFTLLTITSFGLWKIKNKLQMKLQSGQESFYQQMEGGSLLTSCIITIQRAQNLN
jgi:hypothetical protein